MDEASKDIPESKARGNSSAIIEIFFSVPKISQKHNLINFMSFSLINCITSLIV